MGKKLAILGVLFFLVLTIVPCTTNAEELKTEMVELLEENQGSENKSTNEEVTMDETTISEIKNYEETIVVEEMNNFEETPIKAVNMETQKTRSSTTRAITYPATISSIFPDSNLAKAVADQLAIKISLPVTVNSNVTKVQLNQIDELSAASINIVNLQGLDELSNLATLNLAGNKIANISNVDWTKLSNIIYLDFTQNQLETLGPNAFNGLTKMERLFLGTNKISDLGQVNWAQFTSLQILGLYFNKISDISNVPWDQMPALNDLRIFNNNISDISSIPCDKVKVDAKNQTITLAKVDYTTPILLNNPIVSYTGISSPINTISNGGTYDDATKVFTWDIPNGTTPVTFTWKDTDASVGGTTKPLIFSGTATVPVEVKFNLTFKNADGTTISEGLESVGATITAPTPLPRVGYTFAGWTPSLATTMPANDVTYTAAYTANTDTAYKVEHYQEQLDGSYTVFETENLQGTTESTVNAVEKTYEGFP